MEFTILTDAAFKRSEADKARIRELISEDEKKWWQFWK